MNEHKPNKKMIVSSIHDSIGGFIHIFEKDCTNYFVMADKGTDIHVGDEIEYEPYGSNFGFFIRVLTER